MHPDYPVFMVTQGSVNPYAPQKAHNYLKALDKDAQNNVLNLEDLFSDYKA